MTLSAEDEYSLRSDDYVMEMPQVRRADRRPGRMRAFQEAYPNPPRMTLRRIVGSGELFVVEAVSDYGDQVAHVADIVEFDPDGLIRRETRYYAAPFDPPAWRAEWLERIPDGG